MFTPSNVSLLILVRYKHSIKSSLCISPDSSHVTSSHKQGVLIGAKKLTLVSPDSRSYGFSSQFLLVYFVYQHPVVDIPLHVVIMSLTVFQLLPCFMTLILEKCQISKPGST